jgi:host factor-I protein
MHHCRVGHCGAAVHLYTASLFLRERRTRHGAEMLPSVQDDFLQMLVNDKTTVNVFLVSGIRLSGQLAGFDQFAVLLESGSDVQLVFKHAISTVLPVNDRSLARDPTEVPVSGGKPNHLRGRVR